MRSLLHAERKKILLDCAARRPRSCTTCYITNPAWTAPHRSHNSAAAQPMVVTNQRKHSSHLDAVGPRKSHCCRLPFLINNDAATLRFNPYAWNKVANLLFLESPVGVGFSYSNRSWDVEHPHDWVIAQDSYAFLLGWFAKFPHYKSLELYIAGVSYAGHYVPQLAELIHERNKRANSSYINLKGIMIGNPLLEYMPNFIMSAEFAWNHGIISYNLYQTLIAECKPLLDEFDKGRCSDILKEYFDSFEDIDYYHIYMPTCSKSNSSNREVVRSGFAKEPTGHDPCKASLMDIYLNRDDMQKAIHANVTHLPYPYSRCSNVIRKSYNRSEVLTVLPSLRKLVDAGYRTWIYSGDADAAVPFQSTRQSVMNMKLTEKKWDKWGGWRRWNYEGQVARWMVEYVEGLTFISVRGAGHSVLVYAPGSSLSIFSHFLKGEPLPSTNA